MLKLLLPFTFLLITTRLLAQSCHCAAEFAFLKADIENNYAGFTDKVNSDTKAAYDSFSEDIMRRARKATTPVRCLALMEEWIAFFKDGHTSVNPGDGPPIVDSAESVAIPPERLQALRRGKGIEGIYYNPDSTYTMAIISSKTDFRDYAGVILDSKVSQWKPGQVKLELRSVSKTGFMAYAYSRDHEVHVLRYDFDGNALNGGAWAKQPVPVRQPDGNTADRQWRDQAIVQSRRISDQTFYISIESFDVSNIHAIDSVVKANADILRATPYLIIDIRGNGGGGDDPYGSLIPWLYTDPIHYAGVVEWSTNDNILRWAKFLNDPAIPESIKETVKGIIATLQPHIGQYVQMAGGDTVTLPTIEPYPKKVVVLMDDRCASAAEEFLLMAKQSKKVTLMGQHSAGILDYSNVLQAPFPCLPFVFQYATSKSERIGQGKGIDNVGVQPAIALTPDKNWIVEATRFLERK
jgi:hypothetical protein